MLLALADNLRENAPAPELGELLENVTPEQAEFLRWLGTAADAAPPSAGVAALNPERLPSRLHYIRGIIRNRLQEKGNYYSHGAAFELLAGAYVAGVSVEELEDIAKSLSVKTWTHFRDAIDEAMIRKS